jgi:hypothetical protein
MYDVYWGVDPMTWDYGYYDPYYIYAVVGQVIEGGDGGLLEGGKLGIADGGIGGGKTADGGSSIASRLPRSLGALLSAWGARIRQDCPPMTQFVDNDGDGIPASYNATFNCQNETFGDRVTTVTGSVTVSDSSDSSVTAGLLITFTDFLVNVVKSDGSDRSRTLNGTVTFAPSDDGTYQGTHDLTIAFSFADPGQSPVQGTFVSHGTAVYTPDAGATDPFAAGMVDLSGQGTLTDNFSGLSTAHMITRSTNPPLHWNRSCRTSNANAIGFDSGTIVYSADNGNTLHVAFNGCSTPAITHNP